MRRDEIQIGAKYQLTRRGGTRFVTAIETPEDVRARGLVRVRHEDGVMRGKTTDQQLRFLKPQRHDFQEPTWSPPPEATTIVEDGPWPPEPGDRVRWPDRTGDLEWTVVKVDLKAGVAIIASELFTVRQTLTAPLSKLEEVVPLLVEL